MRRLRREDEEERQDKLGGTRRRCESGGSSAVARIENSAKRLDELLGWLLTRERQADMPGGGRTFRRRTEQFWHVWPGREK